MHSRSCTQEDATGRRSPLFVKGFNSKLAGESIINSLILVLTQVVPPHPTLSPACAEASAGRHQGRGHFSYFFPLRPSCALPVPFSPGPVRTPSVHEIGVPLKSD